MLGVRHPSLAGAVTVVLLTVSAAAAAQQPDIDHLVRDRAPALSGTILATRGGAVVYQGSFGLANRQFDIPAANDTRFRIASITKLFTATLVLQLRDERRLQLDATVDRYLPACGGQIGPAVTVRQLLTHTSGLADIVAVTSKEDAVMNGMDLYQHPYSTDEILRKYCDAPPANRPGAAFFYNNGDYVILGKILEALEGQPFSAVLGKRILGPLGLHDTGMLSQHEVMPRLASSYFTRDDATGVLANDMPVYDENWYAAGAMYSTAADLERFARALFGGRLTTPDSLALLITPGLDDYGFGTWAYKDTIAGRDVTTVMRPGQIMGANTILLHMVEPDVTVVVLSNTDKTDVDALARAIATALVP